ncbi:RNA polymerase sigma factor SigD [Bacillaceae bacterium JMAK1]|nr:RNA polymerase sigma factor SigD [Bacillaceae bacterium JMAK1]
MAKERLEEAWEQWITSRDKDAANQLIQAYLPLVDYHVHRILIALPKNMERDELRSHGLMGLYDALQKFDHERELKFDTYASFRVRGAIIDSLRKEDWLPRSTREKMKRIDETTEHLEQRLGRHVSETEVAHELGLTSEEVLKTTMDGYIANFLSIDQETKPENDQEDAFQTILKDENNEIPHEKLEQKLVYEQLQERISLLNENEKLVISLFYFEELTLTEIGKTLRLSTSRISQIHSKALFRLRTAFKKSTAVY